MLVVFSLILVGAEGIGEYLHLLKFYGTTESGFGSYPRDMHNLRALVQYSVPFEYALYLWLVLAVPVAMATMWMNAQTRANESSGLHLWIGNFMAIMLLTPHLYPHDLALLIVPTALVLKLRGDLPYTLIHFALIMVGILPLLPFLLGDHVPPLVPLFLLAGVSWCARFVWQAKRLHERMAAVKINAGGSMSPRHCNVGVSMRSEKLRFWIKTLLRSVCLLSVSTKFSSGLRSFV